MRFLFLIITFLSTVFIFAQNEPKTLITSATELMKFSKNDEALEKLNKAKNLLEGKERGTLLSDCYNGLGLAYWNNGNIELATQYHEQALSLRRKLLGKNDTEVGNSYNNLGLVYVEENPQQALTYFNRAKKIYTNQLGENNAKTSLTSINIAFANAALENYDEALNLLKKVQENYQQKYPNKNPNKAFILSSIGRIYEQEKQLDKALELQNQALKQYKEIYGDKHTEIANTYFLIGKIQQKQSNFKAAIKSYQNSIYANLSNQSFSSLYESPEIDNYLNPNILLTSIQAKAKVLEAYYFEKSLKPRDINEAIKLYKLCDELITVIRQERLNEKDKLRLGKISKQVYENGIRLSLIMSEQSLKPKKHLKTAFEFCERSKSAVLHEAISETKAKKFAGIPAKLLVKEDSLKDKISLLEQQLSDKENMNNQQLKNSLFSYQNAYRNHIQSLEKQFPKYFNLKYNTKLKSLEEIQEVIPINTVLLSYFIGEKSIYIFKITDNKITATNTPIPENFFKKIEGFRNSIKFQIKNTYIKIATELYKILIPKISKKINKLVIFPDGILNVIPFETLLENKENTEYAKMPFLVNKYAISYNYSINMFIQKRIQENTFSIPKILLVAPINFKNQNQKIPSLPGTETEVKKIDSLMFANNNLSEILLKSKAKESIIKKQNLNQYKYIHIASHGKVNESNPALSKIFLNKSNEEDGNLYSGEIYNLKINADLITLSACETGLGKMVKGEGIIGLNRAFQYAGAKNMVVSLWQVSDASTSDLMIDFYKNHFSNTDTRYCHALQNSKLKLIQSKKYQAPYYWAPFIVIGE